MPLQSPHAGLTFVSQHMKSLMQLHAFLALPQLQHNRHDCKSYRTQQLIQQHDWLSCTTSKYLVAAQQLKFSKQTELSQN